MTDLKPCPFCGGENLSAWDKSRCGVCVRCDNCNSQTDWLPTIADAKIAWNKRAEKEPAPLTGGYGHDQYLIGGIKMTEEKLKELNKLQRRIEDREEALHTLKEFRGRKVVITDHNNGSIRIPDELHNVFLTLLEDYYTRKLNELKEEFKEG